MSRALLPESAAYLLLALVGRSLRLRAVLAFEGTQAGASPITNEAPPQTDEVYRLARVV